MDPTEAIQPPPPRSNPPTPLLPQRTPTPHNYPAKMAPAAIFPAPRSRAARPGVHPISRCGKPVGGALSQVRC